MKRKLKVILGETPRDTTIFIHDEHEKDDLSDLLGEEYKGYSAIGFIQDIKCSINAYEPTYKIEITFPDYFSLPPETSNVSKLIAWHIQRLKEFPNVKIFLQDIFDENKITLIKEIGTDGVIDSIKLGDK